MSLGYPSRAAIVAAIFLPAIAYADTPAVEDAFSPYQGATALVVHTIDEARHTLRVAAYSFTSRPIADALIAARQRGVDFDDPIYSEPPEAYSFLAATDGRSKYSTAARRAAVFTDGAPALQRGRPADGTLIFEGHGSRRGHPSGAVRDS